MQTLSVDLFPDKGASITADVRIVYEVPDFVTYVISFGFSKNNLVGERLCFQFDKGFTSSLRSVDVFSVLLRLPSSCP